jgi:hypothetical protein
MDVKWTDPPGFFKRAKGSIRLRRRLLALERGAGHGYPREQSGSSENALLIGARGFGVHSLFQRVLQLEPRPYVGYRFSKQLHKITRVTAPDSGDPEGAR